MSAASPLDRLAGLYGVEPSYTDIWKQEHKIGADSKRALLKAMGVAADHDADVERSLDASLRRKLERPLPKVVVSPEGTEVALELATGLGQQGTLAWSITSEAGGVFSGEAKLEDLQLIDRHQAQKRQRVRLPLSFEGRLPPGYHRGKIVFGQDVEAETSIIITPKRAYWPDCLSKEGGLQGVMAPLYGLRSRRNAGIGDFADLQNLAQTLASLGSDFIGVNPVHALFPSAPKRFSPYAPSSRRFLNVSMIAIDQLPECGSSKAAKALLSRPEIEAQLLACRASELVDYKEATRIKLLVLEALFKDFQRLPITSDRRQSFQAFIEAGGEPLARHCCFEALYDHLTNKDETLTDWHDWPAAYQAPDSEAVRAFAIEHQGRVSFYGYLQWLAATQLEQAKLKASAAGMPIGLYLDLAVGVAPDGAEAWSDQDLLVDGVRIGAPPDDFNPNGQNWGLAPLSPSALQERAYRPFIDLLRQTMRYAGALRIDHVIGLARSFWLPESGEEEGAYIRYPLKDLLGIVALESMRHQCVVIGEDLGTVPKSLRSSLRDHGLLGCRLVYFERDEQDNCRRASDYPKAAIASISTHDLPTLKGFWEGQDIDWRARLGLFEELDQADRDRAQREKLKAELLHGLEADGLLPEGIDPEQPPACLPSSLAIAFHRFLAQTPAALKAIQLEDALGAIEQANLPGTIDEHPNWRRKITVPLEELETDPGLKALLQLFLPKPGGIQRPPS